MPAPPVDHRTAGSAWREAGSGPPVLFLHGLSGTRLAWEPQLEGLADRFRCIAWDMPGYGGSAAVPRLTFPALVDAIGRLLDLLELERCHLVGLSFGAQQAMHFALAHPPRVDRLVLADTSPRFGADGTDPDEWKRLRLAPFEAGATLASVAPQVLDGITAPGFGGRERERTLAAAGHITNDAFRAAVECLPTHDVSDRLSEIACPALVVVGEHDEETPIAYAEFLAAHIPDGRLAVIPGAGHLTPAEAPDEFNTLVGSFLS